MKKKQFILFALAVLSVQTVAAQMSNAQIESYVRQNMSSGKSRMQIAEELQSKGVTADQISNSGIVSESDLLSYQDSLTSGLSRERTEKNDSLLLSNHLNVDIMADRQPSEIYGQDFFYNPMLSFEPNANVAVPQDYVLGPRDQLIVDVWGENETSFKSAISPDGRIMIPQVGPLYLSGLNLKQAEAKIKKALSSKYSLSGPDASSNMSLTLGNIRSIKVNIVGEVKVPGTYRVSSLSTVFNALYRTGGISELGSVRNIKLTRNGSVVSTVDLYKYLVDGDTSCNIPLKEGDVIIVPPYQSVVTVSEGFRRERKYEMLPGETAENIVKFSGGFVSGAHDGDMTVQRLNGKGGRTYTVSKADFDNFILKDGDLISAHINAASDLFENQVVVEGAVMRPGIYALGGDIATVRQLVEKAGGLLDNAFKSRALIVREKKDRTKESISVAIGAIVDGAAQDVMLTRNDCLIISDIRDVEKKGNVTITGFVNNPGDYPYEENMTVEDLILKAGGLVSGASMARVDIARVINDPKSKSPVDTISKVFSISLENGLPADGKPEFTLEPHDIVSVRKSPSFVNQQQVNISGEVVFPGSYSLRTNDERLSSLFKRAGGPTSFAYLKGATLKRPYTEEELDLRKNMATFAMSERDSSNIDKLSMSGTYFVGINLEKAIEKPMSDYDITLREGDELIVPALNNTVRIMGEVFYPNAVGYIENKPVSYYIKQAGGFSNEAKRADVYVVHMNGNIDKGLGSKVYPGSEIMVPARPPRHQVTTSEILSIGTASATLCTIIVTLTNMIKR